jgi:hypothetical protein
MLKSLILGGALLLSTIAGAQAQRIVDGADVDEILKIARSYGSATLGSQTGGDPEITGQIEGVDYKLSFMNCTDNANCEDLNFGAVFPGNKQTLEVINAWNRDRRFGRAYVDASLDAAVEFDVNLEFGVTRDNMDAALSLWSLILDQYTTYIGHK